MHRGAQVRGGRLLGAQLLAIAAAAALAVLLTAQLAPASRAAGSRRAAAPSGNAAPERDDEATNARPVGAVVEAPATPSAHGPQAAWVVRENRRPGTPAWRIDGDQHAGDLEGFADHVSAVVGDTVTLYVSTVADSYHVEAYRMGYYQGLGGRLAWTSPTLPGGVQAAGVRDPTTNMVEAPWRPSLSVHIDPSWVQGDYLFKLVGDGGQQQYVPLTVRDDQSHAAYVVQNSVTTWQAYNLWDGYSLYYGQHGTQSDYAHRARVVSFDRPYAQGNGGGEFLNNELGMVSLVESEGLDVTYWTDVDFGMHPERLLDHRALLSLGHDEYWSLSMRNGAEAARDHGVNLGFFGANAAFRHIRFADSPLGQARREIDYKVASEDPLLGKDDADVTSQWREPPLPRPESLLIGDFYECNPVDASMVVSEPDAWVFAGTGLTKGEPLPHVVGQEYDRYTPSSPSPPDVEVFAHSPVRCRGQATFSDMTYYTAPSGAGVFATGTNWWIGKMSPPCPGDPCVGAVLSEITANVLALFGQGPAGGVHPSVPNGPALGITPNSRGYVESSSEDVARPVSSPTRVTRPGKPASTGSTARTEPAQATEPPPTEPPKPTRTTRTTRTTLKR